jgi:hypothetical protein
MRNWIHFHGPVTAFVVLALIGGVAIDESAHGAADTLYHAQIAACHRQNDVRRESNARVPSHEAEKNVVRDLLETAEAARKASGSPSDEVAAAGYHELIVRLDRDVIFHVMPLVNCQKDIPKP